MAETGHYGNGSLAVGRIIGGRFRIDDFLGVGGMGVVLAATHVELGTKVAIKMMRDELVANPQIVERFVREARAVLRLTTDHVCKVLDIARLDSGAPYIVMELLAGSDLARAALRQPLPSTIAVEYVLQACVALAEAHKVGIVHRDLKPANLFVTRRPDGGPLVKVLDFGIAKALFETDAALTRTRMMMGSPGYMSPEQIESAKDVDLRTDIWALGVTLYQLLSTRMPFPGRNATEIAVRVATEAPVPLEADPALAAIVMRCLAKRPDDRYADVSALADELARFGGPSGRAIAAAVARASGRVEAAPAQQGFAATMPSGFVPAQQPPAGSATAPSGFAQQPPSGFAATVATGGPSASNTPMGSATAPSAFEAAPSGVPPSALGTDPRRDATGPATSSRSTNRALFFVVPAVVIAGLGITLAVVFTRGSSSTPNGSSTDGTHTVVASTPGDADHASHDVVATDAGMATTRDTHRESADAADDPFASPDASINGATSVDAADEIVSPIDLSKLPRGPGMPTAQQMQQGLQMAAQVCRQMLDGKMPVPVPIDDKARFACACMIRDATRAQALLDKAPDKQKPGMRSACSQFGLSLK